ncbi:hypothetical protein RF11_03135 [Thelohanellus kitauei]|uniref:Uncharacterized protein n=1 Tax=Thelohanellus kitauei TaxID=669202 RepID=A0A0C2JZG3_THEKT|nr:hypothetical protein RF11_03135 [Thelohanellus kitauei]
MNSLEVLKLINHHASSNPNVAASHISAIAITIRKCNFYKAFSIKLNRSVSDLGDAGHRALFKTQDHPFNEKHFSGHFMEAFERFFSSGIHECIFIMDNVRFHKTNRV